jgi:hypothetical protein
MTTGATTGLESALRLVGIADRSGDPRAYYKSAARCKDELKSILDDEGFWQRLKEPERLPTSRKASAASDDDLRQLEVVLEDKLADVIVRVGYEPPPEAIELIQAPRELAREATDPDLPQATREDLVGACRTELISLHNLLHQKLRPLAAAEGEDAEPSIPPDTASSMLRIAKPGLLGMVVLDEVASSTEDPPTFRLHVTNASMNLVVRWLSCLDATLADR